MSFISLINLRNCKVTRLTDVLLEKTSLLGVWVLDYPPPRAACMQVEISGFTPGVGSIVITGTVGGVLGISETIAFSGNGIEVGEKEFTVVSGIAAPTLMANPVVGDVEIRAVTPTGQPVFWEKTIFKEMPAWVDTHKGGVQIVLPGGVITSVTKLFTKYNALTPVLENDIIYFRNRKYRVDFIEETFTRSKISPHHLELILKEAKTK